MTNGKYIVLTMLLALVACTPDPVCRQDMHVNAGITPRWFQVDANNNRQLTFTWDSVQVQGMGSDSVIRYKNSDCAYLPMRADTITTAYRITWHKLTDSLWIYATNELNFISMACGCIIYHRIDSIVTTHHYIDSTEVLDASISGSKQENILLYLHDLTEEE